MEQFKKYLKPLILIVLLLVGSRLVLDSLLYEKEITRRLVIRKVNCLDCQQSEVDVTQIHSIQFEVLYEVYRRPKGIATFPDGGSGKYLVELTQAYTWDLDKDVLQKRDGELPWMNRYDNTVSVFGYPENDKLELYRREQFFEVDEFPTRDDFLSEVLIQAITDKTSNQVKQLTAQELGLPFR